MGAFRLPDGGCLDTLPSPTLLSFALASTWTAPSSVAMPGSPPSFSMALLIFMPGLRPVMSLTDIDSPYLLSTCDCRCEGCCGSSNNTILMGSFFWEGAIAATAGKHAIECLIVAGYARVDIDYLPLSLRTYGDVVIAVYVGRRHWCCDLRCGQQGTMPAVETHEMLDQPSDDRRNICSLVIEHAAASDKSKNMPIKKFIRGASTNPKTRYAQA